MLLALWAYDNVDKVSSKLMEAGDTVAISEVLVLPPRESCSKRVNLDSLKKKQKVKDEKGIIKFKSTFFQQSYEQVEVWQGMVRICHTGLWGFLEAL